MEESTGLAPDPRKSVSLSRTTQYLDWFTLQMVGVTGFEPA